jgi:TolA-binding protein
MLKMAFCQIELGEKAKAKETLQLLIRNFPWSEPARKAKERLQFLG